MNKNLWAERYGSVLRLTDNEMESRLTRLACVSPELHDHPPQTAANELDAALKAIHIPSAQELAVIRRILGRAHAYALVRYPSVESFVAGMYARRLEIEPLPATAVTAIAGFGKSEIMDSVQRLVPEGDPLVLPDGTVVPMLAGIRLKVDRDVSERQLRTKMLAALGAPDAELGAKSHPLEILQKRAFVSGCCYVVQDEMQFLTQSLTANTTVNKALLAGTYIGPPFVFVANFSLLHRLLRRNQEDHERLLSGAISLEPETPDSPSLRKMIEEWCRASDGVLALDSAGAAEALDNYTGGSKRAMRELVVHTYERKRSETKAKRVRVTLSDIDDTYRSQEFFTLRTSAELLIRQRATGRQADRKRKDLWNPLRGLVLNDAHGNEQMQENARRTLQKRTSDRIIESSMTPAERDAAKDLRQGMRGDGVPQPPRRPTRRRSEPVTLAEMLARARK